MDLRPSVYRSPPPACGAHGPHIVAGVALCPAGGSGRAGASSKVGCPSSCPRHSAVTVVGCFAAHLAESPSGKYCAPRRGDHLNMGPGDCARSRRRRFTINVSDGGRRLRRRVDPVMLDRGADVWIRRMEHLRRILLPAGVARHRAGIVLSSCVALAIRRDPDDRRQKSRPNADAPVAMFFRWKGRKARGPPSFPFALIGLSLGASRC